MAKNLKNLQVLADKYKNEIKAFDTEIQHLHSQKKLKLQNLEDVQKQIKLLCKEPIVTEHAILRYLERVGGINTEDVKSKIMPESLVDKIKIVGDGEYPVGDFKIRVRDNQIVTVYK
jgi:hypothetical protein